MTTNSNHLSVVDKLVVAAYGLEEDGNRPFSAEDLVVSAWTRFPDTFGLAGYRNRDGRLSHPDSNRVFAEIMGSKTIRKKGLLVKVGSKRYQLTEAGRQHARSLSAHPKPEGTKKAGLAREIAQELRRLLTSRAAEKYRLGGVQDISFFDASAFWGISPRSSATDLSGRIENFVSLVETAKQASTGEGATLEHGGIPFTVADLDLLLELHSQLEAKFGAELQVIKARRSDER
jgi:hypothetical protein